ncbi:tRNA synthetases class I (C) catalytic domain-containing protein [Apodospora peruviana]|uniref:tRNA synthetases class I (C) catalytic domain-containing protein n=1 Tax=Apodospora peruviana TaxID=516989 RepID=A0AAE0HVS3_9PEZI|nr:tRNA synthetases class I (C) catalytic domain-containing protein [Apodospora peruviana]
MASDCRRQPPWIAPQAQPDAQLPRLKIYNSLTRSKDDFVPVDSKMVTWYACGPTVYEDAHLGHAKDYVSTDIIRRVMKDYFGFRLEFAKAAFQQYIGKNLPTLPSDTSPETFCEAVDRAYATVNHGQAVTVEDLRLRGHIGAARSAAEALQGPGKLPGFYAKMDDILLPYLDGLHGAEIDFSNHKIYLELNQKFERRFSEDMDVLNVLPPDQLTRVTEYVPQIIRFVEKIMANDFAYATRDSSVYFDIDSFEKAGHSYSRLEPWNKNDRSLQADGEGALSKGKSMKRSENHFAGHGRPRWHIECSAMASELIGKTIDIHSGGVDLRFPHHDNELAQSEAYWSTPGCQVQWTNYFIHMGQLRIRGLKMSKNLKNYTTIGAVLSGKEWSARSLRICFLLMPWQDGIEVTDELMKAVVGWEGKLNNFFLKSLDIWKHSNPQIATTLELGFGDQLLLSVLDKAKADVDIALCDSCNTSAVMRILSDLVTEFNLAEALSDQTVILLARWVTRIVTIFGLDHEGYLSNPDRIGWSGLDIPAPSEPYIYLASQLRDEVRTLACSGSVDHTAIAKLADEITTAASTPVVESSKPYDQVLQHFRTDVKALAAQQAPAKDLLALCDQFRDTHLWNLGIYLEDRNNSKYALVRPLDKILMEARAERGSAGAAKAKAKLEQEAREAEREKALRERAKLDPLLEWDESGIPTTDATGNPVSKNRRKKLVKEWEAQRKRYEEWLAMQQA